MSYEGLGPGDLSIRVTVARGVTRGGPLRDQALLQHSRKKNPLNFETPLVVQNTEETQSSKPYWPIFPSLNPVPFVPHPGVTRKGQLREQALLEHSGGRGGGTNL